MKHVLQMIGSAPWFIEPRRAQQLLTVLEHRLEHGAPAQPYLSEEQREAIDLRARVDYVPMPAGPKGATRSLARIPMIGTIMPRGDLLSDMSGGGGVSLTRFQKEFTSAVNDPNVGAILLEVDSPGGQVSLVPETARMIKDARGQGKKITAIANTMAGSAAYWIASAADELIVTPSGMVGSIGVFALHEDHSTQLEAMGVRPTFIYEGARKVEGNPFGPLDDVALNAIQSDVRAAYEQFTADVAEFRGVATSVVRADPEGKSAKSFGGGRSYAAPTLKRLGLVGKGGMVDRVATMNDTIARLTGRVSRNPATRKAKLAMI